MLRPLFEPILGPDDHASASGLRRPRHPALISRFEYSVPSQNAGGLVAWQETSGRTVENSDELHAQRQSDWSARQIFAGAARLISVSIGAESATPPSLLRPPRSSGPNHLVRSPGRPALLRRAESRSGVTFIRYFDRSPERCCASALPASITGSVTIRCPACKRSLGGEREKASARWWCSPTMDRS